VPESSLEKIVRLTQSDDGVVNLAWSAEARTAAAASRKNKHGVDIGGIKKGDVIQHNQKLGSMSGTPKRHAVVSQVKPDGTVHAKEVDSKTHTPFGHARVEKIHPDKVVAHHGPSKRVIDPKKSEASKYGHSSAAKRAKYRNPMYD
jgi:hypothetical protein